MHKILLVILVIGSSFVLRAESDELAKVNPNQAFFLFEENKGQFDDQILFRCRLPNGFMYLGENGITYLLEDQEALRELHERMHNYDFIGPQLPVILKQHVVRLKFINQKKPTVRAYNPANYYLNYYKGSDSSKWATGVKMYTDILYANVFPGIDLRIYNTTNGDLKFDWIVGEGDARDIRYAVEGADDLMIRNNELIIQTSVGELTETAPLLIRDKAQSNNFNPNESCFFLLRDSVVQFGFNSEGIKSNLIVDPALIFSTYSGSRGDNFGFTATYDSRGNLFAAGITDGDDGQYPVTTGAVQTIYGGGAGNFPANLPCDITISKYDSSGEHLLWATYLGGDLDEYPHSLVTDRDDDLLVFGTTYSHNFPTSSNAYDRSFNGDVDIIVSKISSDGTVLMGSTFIGGSKNDGHNSNSQLRHNYADDFRGDIIPNENKEVFIASCTESEDFPMLHPVDSVQKFQEGCIVQLSPDLSQLLWSTFLGGDLRDALYSIRIDGDSFIYVGGGTSSTDLQTTDSAIFKTYQGLVDGYVARLNTQSKKLLELSYWGTDQYDQVYFLDLDQKGHVYLTGQTNGNIEPSPGVYGSDNKGQFIVKLDTSLSHIVWQTSFGVKKNAIDLSPSAFLVDNCEHIYVSGWGSSVRPDLNPGSTNNLPTTSDAVQKTTDGNDFYILVLNKDAQGLLYATYFGGDTTADHVDGGTSRFDKKGVIYQSVCSSCPNGFEKGHQDFPVTPNAAFTTNFSPRCSNASFKIDLQIKSAVDAYFVPDPVIGCMPLTVNLENRSDIVKKFRWDFGDGTSDSVNLEPAHTYSNPGTYTITLTVIDSNTCNISDQFKRTITVLENGKADFSYTFDACTNLVQFTTSAHGPEYLWILGDGDSSSSKSFQHVYPPSGSYEIWFYENPGTLCADSVKKVLNTNDPSNRSLLVPNVFTPDGDGYNDEYCLQGFTPGCDSIHLYIYNRWGELVFETDKIDDCWDGSVLNRNRKHPPGTYFYILDVFYGDTKKDDRISGTISLITGAK